MRKLNFFGRLSTSVLVLGFIFSGLTAPATAAPQLKSQVVSGFKGSNKNLSSSQKSKLSAAIKKYSESEKVTCVGLVYQNRNASLARARAKGACDYLKKLQPGLVYFVTSSKTTLSKEAGQVEVQYRWTTSSGSFVKTDPIDFKINTAYKVGKKCGGGFGWQVVGLDGKNNPAFLKCSNPKGGVFRIDSAMPKIDPVSKQPLVPSKVPNKTLFGYSPNLYIEPQVVTTMPKTALTAGSFSDYAQCKIAEVNDGSPDKSFGFPLPASRLDLKQDFKILVIPVQFNDHKTKNKPAVDMADVTSSITNFYVRASSVPISFEWTIPDSYYPIGKTIDSFDLGIDFDITVKTDFWTNYRVYLQEVVDLVDEEYDFSEYDAVVIEEPRTVTDSEHGMFVPHAPNSSNPSEGIFTDEGQIQGLLVTGNDELRDIPNWIHEFGHLLGLPDRNHFNDTSPGFDIMWGSYGSPELSVWSRWQLEILKDQQVDCKTDTAPSTHLVQPVAWVGDYKKGVVIPVSDHEVLVVESRRRQGYDALFGKESEGAYVYRIDTSALIYQKDTKNPVNVVAPARSKPVNGSWALDASLKLGESVTSDGWTIKVVETGAFGDVIEVSKKG
jgi:M6 family metalloprotease-like protein